MREGVDKSPALLAVNVLYTWGTKLNPIIPVAIYPRIFTIVLFIYKYYS